ncbi:hypothetical protein PV328_012149 [Microctonus aethiopoides]|uniref:THAP-type domain-containing protein n=1 Tax=Microctonus aethiopoides TaxID=144406 RepID=A0AA39EZI7_9HYME|nr:hypothetical protein PV328_012149 [Microctonus aethiopoides]
MRLHCAVPNCNSKSSKNVNLSYHRFSPSDKCKVNVTNDFGIVEKVDLYSEWTKVTNIPNPKPNDRICSRHFRAADYCGNGTYVRRYAFLKAYFRVMFIKNYGSKFCLCISGVRHQRRKLEWDAIPSLHLPITNEERHERNEKQHAIMKVKAINAETKHRYENNVPEPMEKDIETSESVRSTTEAGETAFNAETKQKYENNVPEPMEKDIETSESVQSTTEARETAFNAETKQKYENNVPEPMEKDIEISESVQSTTEAGEDFEMVQMVIERNAANILPKVFMSEDVGVQATIENDSRDVGVQAIENDSRDVGVQATIENDL